MAGQPFDDLRLDRGLPHSSLLETIEHLTVDDHRRLHQELGGEPWSPPIAYRWMRYESPDPVGRLIQAGLDLEGLWEAAQPSPALELVAAAAAEHEERHLEEAEAAARLLGYSG
jgi:hypothetical protein